MNTPELEAGLTALVKHWRALAEHHGLDSHIGQMLDSCADDLEEVLLKGTL